MSLSPRLFSRSTFCPSLLPTQPYPVRSSLSFLAHNNRRTISHYTSLSTMVPPNQRRDRPQGDRGHRNHPYPSTPIGSLLPVRPHPEAAQPEVIDVQRLYSTDTGEKPQAFAEMDGKLNKALLAGVSQMGYEFMSPVQQKVLTELPSLFTDCLVQAKTGTGKTTAFLLPAIQNLLSGNMPPMGKVGILVLCPTRELALQIAKEFCSLTAMLPLKMECHTAFGGTARTSSLNRLLTGNPHVLVATPGRLDDIMGEQRVREKFTHLKTLVLDEADRMLDIGFAPTVKKIVQRLPPKSNGWQGMCFSATIPAKVQDVVKSVLHPNYTSLSTITADETPTVDGVPQFSIVVPTVTQTFASLIALIQAEYNANPNNFKAIVFGTTANGVALLYEMFKHANPSFKLLQLHSRMNQPARTRATNDFKAADKGILFATDVVGRGMDFPNVGLVIQLGLPANQEQYIHRVGRTARAGKDGRAVLILFRDEEFFLRSNPQLPIQPYTVALSPNIESYHSAVVRAFERVDEGLKAKAYQAFLGFNKTFMKKMKLNSESLVRLGNEYATAMGCAEPPPIDKKVVSKMGLKGVQGLRIGEREERGMVG